MSERKVMPLGEIPGAEKFIESLVSSAADMALAFVGEPDEKVRAHLEQTLGKTLSAKLAEKGLGLDTAAAMTEALIGAVIGHKHELEAKGGGNA